MGGDGSIINTDNIDMTNYSRENYLKELAAKFKTGDVENLRIGKDETTGKETATFVVGGVNAGLLVEELKKLGLKEGVDYELGDKKAGVVTILDTNSIDPATVARVGFLEKLAEKFDMGRGENLNFGKDENTGKTTATFVVGFKAGQLADDLKKLGLKEGVDYELGDPKAGAVTILDISKLPKNPERVLDKLNERTGLEFEERFRQTENMLGKLNKLNDLTGLEFSYDPEKGFRQTEKMTPKQLDALIELGQNEPKAFTALVGDSISLKELKALKEEGKTVRLSFTEKELESGLLEKLDMYSAEIKARFAPKELGAEELQELKNRSPYEKSTPDLTMDSQTNSVVSAIVGALKNALDGNGSVDPVTNSLAATMKDNSGRTR